MDSPPPPLLDETLTVYNGISLSIQRLCIEFLWRSVNQFTVVMSSKKQQNICGGVVCEGQGAKGSMTILAMHAH